MIKIVAIIGARPQFIKHAPLEIAGKNQVNFVTIHTGQHYDDNMSKVFFDELQMAKPNYQLNSGGGSHAVQTGKMLIEIENILIIENPEKVLLYGDTNSTLAGAIAAAKLCIPIIHVEAGLRSFNKSMPEEINRIMTDHVSTMLFSPTDDAVSNLKNEKIIDGVYRVGDIMCDMSRIAKEYLKLNIKNKVINLDKYYLATIHRPYNTDSYERMELILNSLNKLNHSVIFSIHPRTSKMLDQYGLSKENYPNIVFVEPMGYFDITSILINSEGLITDSGGMQKEAYNLAKRCITIRSETEWIETLEGNWNSLVFNTDEISNISNLFKNNLGKHNPTLYGDGFAAQEIINLILLNHNKK